MATLNQKLKELVGNSFGADIVEQNILKTVKEVRDRVAVPQSQFYDPLSMFLGYGQWLYRRGGSQLTYRDMRLMSKNPIIASIIQTRLNQVASFCAPARNKYDQGFKIVSDDPGAAKDSKKTRELTNWVETCGTIGYGESTFEQFTRKFLRDSLVLDQACAEIIYQRDGEPAYWIGVDSGTIRRLKRSLESGAVEGKDPWFVQVFQESRIVAEYAPAEIIFGVRNPHSDIEFAGYGLSELEYLVRIVTALANTEKFNTSTMGSGGLQKGVLVVAGDTNRSDFDAFKRDFRLAVRGAAEYWTPPILNVSKDAKIDWVTLDQTNRDMEYSRLFDFLVKVACGVYQISPEEVNWSITSGSSTTFESRQEDKITASKDKGLKPLLVWYASQITTNLISRVDDRYRLEFQGFGLNAKADTDLKNVEVRGWKTVNEIRADLGLAPIEGMDVILGAMQDSGQGAEDQSSELPGGDSLKDEEEDADYPLVEKR